MSTHRKSNVSRGMWWMFLISVLLFWLPVVGPFIAGFIGGKKAGGLEPAIMAVFLPIVVIGVALFFFGSALTGLPLIGAIAGFGVFVVLIAHIGPMLLGAIIGGLVA